MEHGCWRDVRAVFDVSGLDALEDLERTQARFH